MSGYPRPSSQPTSSPQVAFRRASPAASQRVAQFNTATLVPVTHDEKMRATEDNAMWIRSAVTWIGVLIFSITVLVPCWDAVRLENDAVYAFFLGRYFPVWIAVVCIGAVLWYAIAVRVVFYFASSEFKAEHTVLMITMVTTTLLGLSFLLVSVPMRKDVNDVYTELFSNCHFGSHTQQLYEHATVLQGIRNTEECLAKESVEQCSGYEESQPYTDFLKDLESKYHCAGFCWDGSASEAAATAAVQVLAATAAHPQSGVHGEVAATAVAEHSAVTPVTRGKTLSAALQRFAAEKRQRHRELPSHSGMSLLAVDSDKLGLAHRHGIAHNKSKRGDEMPGFTGAPPPTLFSKVNYEESCDGVSARVLDFKGRTISTRLYYNGVILLATTVIVGFLRLLSLCHRPSSKERLASRPARTIT